MGNALEACALLTPLHIVPEWYFLCQYAMLKAVPNKNAGFIILLTSILAFFSLDRCSIPSREVSILCSYLDIILLFSSYVYLIFQLFFLFLFMELSLNVLSFKPA